MEAWRVSIANCLRSSASTNCFTDFRVYNLMFPVWMPVDIELIKNILTRDFVYFMNHNVEPPEHDVIQHHLFNLTDDKWRNLRIKLTPTFTSGTYCQR